MAEPFSPEELAGMRHLAEVHKHDMSPNAPAFRYLATIDVLIRGLDQIATQDCWNWMGPDEEGGLMDCLTENDPNPCQVCLARRTLRAIDLQERRADA